MGAGPRCNFSFNWVNITSHQTVRHMCIQTEGKSESILDLLRSSRLYRYCFSNPHSLEVVDRVSETQLQMSEGYPL